MVPVHLAILIPERVAAIRYATRLCLSIHYLYAFWRIHFEKGSVLQFRAALVVLFLIQEKHGTLQKMAGRTNGSKVVVLAVAATLTALGIGTVYIPFYADRDKLRGMYEGADGDLSARERREYEKYLQQIHEQRGALPPPNETALPDRSMPKGNSMWSRLNQAASDTK